MTQVVTPSAITIGQISKIQEHLGAALRKSELPSELVQRVLHTQLEALTAGYVGKLRTLVEAQSNLIVRRVRVNRSRTPHAALEATGRRLYLTDDVVAAMPRGVEEEVDVCFFNENRFLSGAALQKAYESHGLTPADPYSVAAVNEDDPAFADDHPNATEWLDKNGKRCYAAFDRWIDERDANVSRDDGGWRDDWWFAGVRPPHVSA